MKYQYDEQDIKILEALRKKYGPTKHFGKAKNECHLTRTYKRFGNPLVKKYADVRKEPKLLSPYRIEFF